MLLALQYRLWFGESSLSQLREVNAQIDQQRSENQRLEQRNRVLEAEVVELQQGVDTLEERARSDLGMIKEGEQFYLTPTE
ncbi:septum formation initiator family protein [Aestuariirhabdus sp. Z084]|nr:septum formation initiator family protein [Aestuariirhabdus haliotis]MCL6420352.1 septum formation initiator family protein [Aestuariirhabdus haliotis]